MEDQSVKWIDHGYAMRDGDGFLIYTTSGKCKTVGRVSRATFRRYIEEGRDLLAQIDREDNVVNIRSG